MSTKTSRPAPSWRVTDENDELSRAICAVNRGHVNIALTCSPDWAERVTDLTTRLYVRLGLTEYRALTLVEIGHMFRRYPSLVDLGLSGARDITLHSDVTETWTSYGDGHTLVTAPNGPLGRETFRHRAVRASPLPLGIQPPQDAPPSRDR